MKIQTSSGSALKLLVLFIVIIFAGYYYKSSVPSFLRNRYLAFLHWFSVLIVVVSIIAAIWIVLDLFVIGSDFGGSERNL